MDRRMRKLSVLVALLATAVTGYGDEELYKGLGGSVEELRVVLDLNPAQVQDLRSLLEEAREEYEGIRAAARARGVEEASRQRRAWQDRLSRRVREFLSESQGELYEEWLDFKQRLSHEYDKALFGLPTVTEMKLRIGLAKEDADRMQQEADEGIEKIRGTLLELKRSGAEPQQLARELNLLRRETIEAMIEGASTPAQNKLKAFVKQWLQPPEDKLSKARRGQLGRLMKALAVEQAAEEKRIRNLVAAVLMHQAETRGLRKGMGKQVLMAVVRAKKEREAWIAMNEYGALIAIHDRRRDMLSEKLKATLSTKQLAKLVAEGIIE